MKIGFERVCEVFILGPVELVLYVCSIEMVELTGREREGKGVKGMKCNILVYSIIF